MNIQQFRLTYPMYNHLSDREVASKLYKQFYSHLPKDTFTSRFGVSPEEPSAIAEIPKQLGVGVAQPFLAAGRGVLHAERKLYAKAEALPTWAGLPGLVGAATRKMKTREKFKEAEANILAQEQALPRAETLPGKAANLIGSGLAQLGISVAAWHYGGPLASGVSIGGIEAQHAYERAIVGGRSESAAEVEGLLVGSINGLIESIGISKFMGFAGKGRHSMGGLIRAIRKKAWRIAGKEVKRIGGVTLKQALVEGVEEFLQEGVSIAVPGFAAGDYPKKPDGSPDGLAIIGQMAKAGGAGAFVGGIFGGAQATFAGAQYAAKPTDVELDNIVKLIEDSKLSQTEKTRQIHEINKLREVPLEVEQTEIGKATDRLFKDIDEITLLRPQEAEAIRRKRGEKFAEAEQIAAQIENPRAALAYAKAAMKGVDKIEIEPLAQDKWTESEADVFYEEIRGSTQLMGKKWAAEAGLNRLFFEGKIPAKHQVEAIAAIFGKDFANKLDQTRRRLGKGKWDKAMETINIPRALLASYDISALMRQGGLMLFVSPRDWAVNAGRSVRAAFSPEYMNTLDIKRKTNSLYQKATKAGVHESIMGSQTLGEERFQSQIAERIPGVKWSERAWTTFLNGVRFDSFYRIANQWEGTGKTAADYKSLAQFLNHATGRGDIKVLKSMMPALNVAFFSPRLLMSRFQVIGDLVNTTSPVRKIVAGNLLEAVGTGILVLTLLNLIEGVDVEPDPRSADFGKVRIGDTRVDFWSGYQQIARYACQLATGQAKTTETDRVIKQKRGQVVWRFLQSKMSPPVGFAVDLGRGETFLGKKLRPDLQTMGRETFERFTPLFIQDVVDGIRYQGLNGLGLTAPTALVGVGVMTYPTTATSETAKLKDSLSKKYFGDRWDNIGPLAQKVLRQHSPNISLMEERARMDREDFGFMEAMAEEQRDSSQWLLKHLPDNVQKELDTLTVRIPGLSRHISSGWFLNENRYKELKNKTLANLKPMLTRVIQTPFYNQLPPEARRMVLQNLIGLCKKKARNEIALQANVNDIQER